MSTFNGVIAEFPSIRIDYFRNTPAPLACFLSHVHSDHLQGLESLRSPFIYCSAVTRELLLRLEKYPHRMNFSNGILEARKQHYRHLAKLLRPIPLNTPTEIELTPLQRIRVTLLDANHCVGAVMILIQGQGNAILYTGDIRAETWWVNSLTRNPVLIPYACGLRTLDNIYLDTTFAAKSNIYLNFPSKAEGIKELLEKVGRYPKDTVFYLRAWTFGYEEVWQALSTFLNSKIHVDRYQYDLYTAFGLRFGLDTTTFLSGFQLGNTFVPGCLTDDENVQIHSCEPGVFCQTMKTKKSVIITPIVTRDKTGLEIPEVGAGGGERDMHQLHELELPDSATVQKLEELLSEHITDKEALLQTKQVLNSAFTSKYRALSLDEFGLANDADIPLKKLVSMLTETKKSADSRSSKGKISNDNTITFPYSRHSSYAELCELVQAFRPKQVFPCTVDENRWNESVSMEALFGHLCSERQFAHDGHMRDVREQVPEMDNKKARYTIMRDARHQLQAMGSGVRFNIGSLPPDIDEVLNHHSPCRNSHETTYSSSCSQEYSHRDSGQPLRSSPDRTIEKENGPVKPALAMKSESQETIEELVTESQEADDGLQPSAGSDSYLSRRLAYEAARIGTFDAWNEIPILSAGDNHVEAEAEL